MDISIGATQHVDGLMDTLNSQFSFSDIKVQLAEQRVGSFTFINCNPLDNGYADENYGERVFKRNVASALAEIIINNWEKEIITRELRINHQYFDEQDRLKVFDRALKVLNSHPQAYSPTVYKSSRKTRIMQKLLDYMEINNQIIVDGFIRFRLKEYYSELKAAIAVAVDEFLLEKEYHEFIRLLRYFVDIQEPKIDTLHVLVKPNGGFQLYDEDNKLVSNDYLEGFVVDLVDNEITYEDLLISALITIAPRFVVLHVATKKDSDTLKTIRNVFGDRVSNCQGCSLCSEISKS